MRPPAFRQQPRASAVKLIAALLGIMMTSLATLQADDTPAPLVVPVRVHLLQSGADPRLQTTLKEQDVKRVFGKVNTIWAQAGIRFEVQSVCVTQAIDPKDPANPQGFWVAERVPKDKLLEHGLNVIYIHEMVSNGVWTGAVAVVKDTAKLREVANGVEEPLQRVTSHELGHALGLAHRQDEFNLMASGTTGFTLNAAEIAIARATAEKKFPPAVKPGAVVE